MLLETISHNFSDSHPEITVELRRSVRAKRYILKRKFTSKIFILTIPNRGTRKQAIEFLKRSNGWILTQYAKAKEKAAIQPSGTVHIHGEIYTIKPTEKTRGVSRHFIADDGERIVEIAGGVAHQTRRLHDYLKKLALQEYTNAALHHTHKLGKPYIKIRLNDPKTRWGSCSSNGTLSFSWRVIMAPPFVLNYLVAHEVAHLQHMNHSAHFWRTVAMLDPNWKEAEYWLKKHGSELHLMA